MPQVEQMPYILIVDDTRATREMLRMFLEDLGYDVLEAADGATALEMLRVIPRRTIALVDLLMPDMTGLDVLRAVRADARLAAAHAYILMTAQHRALPAEGLDVLTALAVHVIHKPFDLDTVLDALAELAPLTYAPEPVAAAK